MKMAPITVMAGAYLFEQLDDILRVLWGKWAPLTNKCIVYLRLWSLDGSKTTGDFKKYVDRCIDKIYADKPANMQCIIGFETCAGDVQTNWAGFWGLYRWTMFAELVKHVQRRLAREGHGRLPVVMVHESSATEELDNGINGIFNVGHAEPAYAEISGLDVWHDLPEPGLYYMNRWLQCFADCQPRWPKTKWKSIAAVPGTYDTSYNPDGEGAVDLAKHVGAVGKRNFIPRIFVSANGLRDGDGFECFYSRECAGHYDLPCVSTCLESYLSKLKTPVILYPGQKMLEQVADTMKGWYVR